MNGLEFRYKLIVLYVEYGLMSLFEQTQYLFGELDQRQSMGVRASEYPPYIHHFDQC